MVGPRKTNTSKASYELPHVNCPQLQNKQRRLSVMSTSHWTTNIHWNKFGITTLAYSARKPVRSFAFKQGKALRTQTLRLSCPKTRIYGFGAILSIGFKSSHVVDLGPTAALAAASLRPSTTRGPGHTARV